MLENINEIDNDLIYKVALYCVDNPILIVNIQNKFLLGFRKAFNIMNRLEELGIVTSRTEDGTRKILITDKEEIKKRIYE